MFRIIEINTGRGIVSPGRDPQVKLEQLEQEEQAIDGGSEEDEKGGWLKPR